ncbi:hypothetical protein KBA01_00310 [Kozakia baliensis]|nr:hypothetical protein KBA01_00310 [Kozakia baliensis]
MEAGGTGGTEGAAGCGGGEGDFPKKDGKARASVASRLAARNEAEARERRIVIGAGARGKA